MARIGQRADIWAGLRQQRTSLARRQRRRRVGPYFPLPELLVAGCLAFAPGFFFPDPLSVSGALGLLASPAAPPLATIIAPIGTDTGCVTAPASLSSLRSSSVCRLSFSANGSNAPPCSATRIFPPSSRTSKVPSLTLRRWLDGTPGSKDRNSDLSAVASAVNSPPKPRTNAPHLPNLCKLFLRSDGVMEFSQGKSGNRMPG